MRIFNGCSFDSQERENKIDAVTPSYYYRHSSSYVIFSRLDYIYICREQNMNDSISGFCHPNKQCLWSITLAGFRIGYGNPILLSNKLYLCLI